jgi:hypothetical protein
MKELPPIETSYILSYIQRGMGGKQASQKDSKAEDGKENSTETGIQH